MEPAALFGPSLGVAAEPAALALSEMVPGAGLAPGGLPFSSGLHAATPGAAALPVAPWDLLPAFDGGDLLMLDPKHKSSKQQANKVSQQKYREKKKAKVSEMEEAIAEMQRRLALVQALQQRNFQLEGQNTELEARLVERERELEQLKAALDRQSELSREPAGAPAPGLPCGAAAAAAQPPPALADPVLAAAMACSGDSAAARGGCGAQVCCQPLAKDISEIDFEGLFEERTAQLRGLVDSAGLRDTDPTGAGVEPGVLQMLAALVGRCCQLRQAAMGAEGAKALGLFQGGRKWIPALADDPGRWAGVFQALKLSDEQQEQLLLLRRVHLASLRAIYQARQDLNLEAMALMLPRQSPMLQRDTTVEGKLANMSSRGYLAIARSNAELCDLLGSIKKTLQQEQRAVMDLNSLVIGRILTPIQAGLYMVLSYPELSDVLALINALARNLGEGGIPGPDCTTRCPQQAQQQQQGEPSSGAAMAGALPSPVSAACCCKQGAGGGSGAQGADAQGCCGSCLPPRSYAVGEGATLSGCCKDRPCPAGGSSLRGSTGTRCNCNASGTSGSGGSGHQLPA